MISKAHLAAGMAHECRVSNHLFTKLTPEAFSYQPSPQQRTTLELLRYLAICGIAGIRSLEAGNWAPFAEYKERVKDMAPEEFPAAMERQREEIEAYFASVSEETLETHEASVPGAGVMPLGVAILNGPFKWLTSYRMQLFLYAKAAGATDIGTANAWAGMDWKG